MKDIKLILIAILLATVGCSSSPKSSDSSPSPVNQGSSDSIAEADDDLPDTAASSNVKIDVTYDQLKQALESQNQRRVEEITSQMLAKNPKDTKALNALAIQNIRNNKPSLARLILKRALDVDSKNAALLNNYALTFYMEKEEWRAMQEWKKALDSDSRNFSAAANIGAIHLKARNYEEARRMLETAYDRNSSNVKVANNFALALMGANDHNASRRVFEKIAGPDQKDASVLLNYAILLVKHLGDKTKGQEVINRVKFSATDPAILERAKQLEAMLK